MKLLLGQLPSASLLARYDLPHYGAVASAVRLGDVAALNAALDAEQARFISHLYAPPQRCSCSN